MTASKRSSLNAACVAELRNKQTARLETIKGFAALVASQDVLVDIGDNDKLFAQIVYLAMNDYGIKQSELAEKAEYSSPAISRWSKGESLPKTAIRKMVLEVIYGLLTESYESQKKRQLPMGSWAETGFSVNSSLNN